MTNIKHVKQNLVSLETSSHGVKNKGIFGDPDTVKLKHVERVGNAIYNSLSVKSL